MTSSTGSGYLSALLEGRQLLLNLVHGVGVNESAVVDGNRVPVARVPVAVVLLQGQLTRVKVVDLHDHSHT